MNKLQPITVFLAVMFITILVSDGTSQQPQNPQGNNQGGEDSTFQVDSQDGTVGEKADNNADSDEFQSTLADERTIGNQQFRVRSMRLLPPNSTQFVLFNDPLPDGKKTHVDVIPPDTESVISVMRLEDEEDRIKVGILLDRQKFNPNNAAQFRLRAEGNLGGGGEGEPPHWAAKVADLLVFAGKILPDEDEPRNPTPDEVRDEDRKVFKPMTEHQAGFFESERESRLFVGRGRYVPLKAKMPVDNPTPEFEWSSDQTDVRTFPDELEQLTKNTYAELNVPPIPQDDDQVVLSQENDQGIVAEVRAKVGNQELTHDVHVHRVVLNSTHLRVPGLTNDVTISADGFSFENGDRISDISGTGVSIQSQSVEGENIEVTLRTADDAATGGRDVTFRVQDEQGDPHQVTIPNFFTVYDGDQAVNSLVTILDRQEFDPNDDNNIDRDVDGDGDDETLTPGDFPGFGPGEPGDPNLDRTSRTEEQEQQIQAVLDAGTVSDVRDPWNAFVQDNTSLLVVPRDVSQEQINLLIEAALQREGTQDSPGNDQKVVNDSPDIPENFWTGIIRIMSNIESTDSILVAASGTEDSYGLFQFGEEALFDDLDNDGEEDDIVNDFTAPETSVPILNPNPLVQSWKGRLANVPPGNVNQLRGVLTGGDGIIADWRSDPIVSIRNLIREFHAFYGRIEGYNTGGFNNTRFDVTDGQSTGNNRTSFQPDSDPDDNTVDAQLGQGSPRDLFEALAVAHQSVSNTFGDFDPNKTPEEKRFGGLIRSSGRPIQVDGWWPRLDFEGQLDDVVSEADENNVGGDVMNQRGVNRAAEARTQFDQEFGN